MLAAPEMCRKYTILHVLTREKILKKGARFWKIFRREEAWEEI